MIFWVFFALTAIVLPIWWWSTAVPRANLCIPTWQTPHHLTRLSKVQLVLVAPQIKVWKEFADMRISPLSGENGGTVQIEDHVDVMVRMVNRTPDETLGGWEKYLEAVSAGLDKVDEQNHQVLLLEGNSKEKPIVWIHPRQRTMVIQNASSHHKFNDPQMFLEDFYSFYFNLLSPSKKAQDRILPDAPLYRITFSLLIGQDADGTRSSARHLSWQARDAAQSFILPMVERLQRVADFKVHYQIKSHIVLGQDPVFHEAQAAFILQEEQLPVLIDENKWNVASSTDRAVPIEFILFVPPRSCTPLKAMIGNQPRQGFGYKQWGGIYILNMDEPALETLTVEHLQPAFSFFAGELKQLFATPMTMSDMGYDFSLDLPVDKSSGISAFELEALRYQALLSRVTLSINTLQALQRLLRKNSEIAVLPAIRTLIVHSLAALSSATNSLALGDLDLAVRLGSEASQLGEAAFYHPTMMAHQYFPQEHKLGVYMPLFFPLVLPIAIASLAALGRWARLRLSGKNKQL